MSGPAPGVRAEPVRAELGRTELGRVALGRAPLVGGIEPERLANRFGTPLLVIDEERLAARLAEFRTAFGPDAELAYAGKAFLCGALARLLDREGWLVDAVSGGELELLRRAGFPMRRVVLHGNAKSLAELRQAVGLGVGRIVLDHPDELEDLRRAGGWGPDAGAAGARPGGGAAARPEVLLRLHLDLQPATHEKIATVGPKAHFGMSPETAAEVARRAMADGGRRLAGAHIHAGSQLRDVDFFARIAEAAVDFVAGARECFAHVVDLDLGGGLAAAQHAGERAPSPAEYAAALRAGLRRARAEERLGAHRILVEPGRSVIANAGVTLYRVHARKRLGRGPEILAVDGGLSDNPRPSLYGARYDVLNASRDGAGASEFRVVGRHCESGDVIAPSAMLPRDTTVGDVLAVASTGAYAFAMSSRYNGVGRPAVVFARDGAAREVIRRETCDDLLSCDLEL